MKLTTASVNGIERLEITPYTIEELEILQEFHTYNTKMTCELNIGPDRFHTNITIRKEPK